jgi:thiol-disulfide isomerase/thioredoxin
VRRSQWAALAGVVVLLAGAFLLRAERTPSETRPDPRVDALRQEVALQDCPPGLGPEVPDLVLPCLGGGEDVALRGAPPGRPTLVNVWGSWCVPCREEVPHLVDLAERAGDRVGVVGVLTQDTPLRGLAFSKDYGIRYPSVVDDQGEVMRAFASGPPVTLFLDAQGRIAHREVGKLDLRELEALVAEHLGVQL